METLEISDTAGNSEYWSLSTAEAVRDGGRDYGYVYCDNGCIEYG